MAHHFFSWPHRAVSLAACIMQRRGIEPERLVVSIDGHSRSVALIMINNEMNPLLFPTPGFYLCMGRAASLP